MTKEIEIKDARQVERINRLASEAPYGVWIHCGTVMLDARSLLGMMALVGKKATVVAGDHVNAGSFCKLVDKMA